MHRACKPTLCLCHWSKLIVGSWVHGYRGRLIEIIWQILDTEKDMEPWNEKALKQVLWQPACSAINVSHSFLSSLAPLVRKLNGLKSGFITDEEYIRMTKTAATNAAVPVAIVTLFVGLSLDDVTARPDFCKRALAAIKSQHIKLPPPLLAKGQECSDAAATASKKDAGAQEQAA